ncbi:MAG: FlgD immunoglobulin-like domain containing protein [Candidatus Eisenbacteria bacterium]
MRVAPFIRTPALLLAAVALVTMVNVARAQEKPPCNITGPVSGCGPSEICGPEGDYDYYWARPFGGLEYTRCIIVEESGTYILWTTDRKTGIQSEPCFHKYDGGKGTECRISGPDEVCKGSKAELCGPVGDYLYGWSGPGDFTAHTRCIDVSAIGEYTLTVTNLDGKCESVCKHEITEKTCEVNCPRTVGFWGAQCAQRKGGSTKFTRTEVTAIASCVDGKAGSFSWGDDFAGFCAAISTADMNQRVQAKRQFAGLLANVCTGELGLIANNGNVIKLSTETVVTCAGHTLTIGELITAIDARLQALEGQSLDLSAVKTAYSEIIGCADGINNGRGIGPLCDELDEADKNLTSGTTNSDETAGIDAAQNPLSLGTLSAYPNPFVNTVRLTYAVAAQGENVTLGVYDLSGRMVKRLADGFQAGGMHQSSWNATDASGTRVRTGMYFIRGKVGERNVASRVMLVE